ncbi:hypothetical protein GCM10028793_38610 [Nocardiopsis oceani]
MMQNVNVIRNNRPPVAATATAVSALLPCLLFGSAAFVTWLGSRAAWLMLPTSLGVPFAFPRLRLVSFVGQPGWNLVVELVAVVLLAAVAAWWVHRAVRRRPEANAWRVLLSAWAGILLGLVLANALRAAAAAAAIGVGPLVLFGFAFAGVLSGLLWAACAGWVCALPVALVHRFTAPDQQPEPAETTGGA